MYLVSTLNEILSWPNYFIPKPVKLGPKTKPKLDQTFSNWYVWSNVMMKTSLLDIYWGCWHNEYYRYQRQEAPLIMINVNTRWWQKACNSLITGVRYALRRWVQSIVIFHLFHCEIWYIYSFYSMRCISRKYGGFQDFYKCIVWFVVAQSFFYFVDIFSCDQAALWMVQSVRPSVCLSVRLSVRHTFLTMFLSTYHHEIFRSYYQRQKWRPCKRWRSEVKGQGHRGHDPT